MTRHHQRGFALIELVLLMTAMGIFAAMYVTTTSQVWRSVGTVNTLENGIRLGQECMEHILSTRRNPSFGFATITVASPSTICSSLPGRTGYTRVVNVTDAATNPACPAAAACKMATVTVTVGSDTPFSQSLLLVN